MSLRGLLPRVVADGTGAPDPQPEKFSKPVSLTQFSYIILHVSELIIWGSGWGFRFHWLGRTCRTGATRAATGSRRIGGEQNGALAKWVSE